MIDAGEASAPVRIFISYRREDSEESTDRLYDALRRHFDTGQLFMDIDTIQPGVDFTKVINEAVSACDVLIAVIGKQWLTVTDSTGARRLDNSEDFVRLEIKAALDRDVRVIPALVQGAEVPPSDELPADISGLARRNAITLRRDNYYQAVERLIKAVEQVAQEKAERERALREPEERAAREAAERAERERAEVKRERAAAQQAARQAKKRKERAAREAQERLERERAAERARQEQEQLEMQRAAVEERKRKTREWAGLAAMLGIGLPLFIALTIGIGIVVYFVAHAGGLSSGWAIAVAVGWLVVTFLWSLLND